MHPTAHRTQLATAHVPWNTVGPGENHKGFGQVDPTVINNGGIVSRETPEPSEFVLMVLGIAGGGKCVRVRQ